MTWSLIIAAGAAVLGLALWAFGLRRRRLARLFRRHIRRHDGSVARAAPLAYPQLRFGRDGLSYRVTALAHGAADGRRTVTAATVTLPGDTGRRIRVTRRAGVLSAEVDEGGETAAPKPLAAGGGRVAGRSFRPAESDDTFLRDLLSPDVRAMLVNAPLDGLEVDVDRTEIHVQCSGVVSTPAELEALIGCAAALAERFLPPH